MAQRKISDYMAELREFFPQIDPGEAQDRIWRAILDIAFEENLAFLVGDAKLVTELGYSTGTVTISPDLVTLTLTGGTWNPAWTKRQITIQGQSERYGVTITGAATATLSETWQNANTTNLTYKIFRDTYSCPADCEFGKDIVWYDTAINRPLDFLDYESFTEDRQDFRSARASMPISLARGQLDSNGVPQLVIDPPPVSARVYNVSYYKTPQRPQTIDLSPTPPWPESFHDVIIFRAAWEWCDRKGHPRRLEFRDRYRQRCRKMGSKFDGGAEIIRRLSRGAMNGYVRGEITLYGGQYTTAQAHQGL